MSLLSIGVKQKRLIAYVITLFFPLLIIYLSLLIGLGTLIAFGLGFIFSLLAVGLIHKVTMNAMARFELNQQPMVAAIDSLGAVNFYGLNISSHDRVAKAMIDGKNIETSYSYSNIFESIFHKTSIPAWNDKTHLHLMIPKEDIRDHRLTVQGVPTFFFNRRGKWFWTKSALSGVEDGMVLENLIAYLTYSTQNLENYVRNYSRSAIDRLWEKFNKPQIWLLIVVFLILLGLFIFGGNILDFIQGTTSNIGGTVGNSLTIPTEASQPLN